MELNKKKLWIDIILFIDFIILASSGFILKFIYPAGEKSGKAGAIFLVDRFTWLRLHSITAIILTILVLIHIFLNWNWIKCMLFRKKQSPESSKSLKIKNNFNKNGTRNL